MPILPALHLRWQPAPRCPACGVTIVPSGRRQPFAVDAQGRVYCRSHGERVATGYELVLREYEEMRRARAEVSEFLFADGHRPSAEDIAAAEAEWVDEADERDHV